MARMVLLWARRMNMRLVKKRKMETMAALRGDTNLRVHHTIQGVAAYSDY